MLTFDSNLLDGGSELDALTTKNTPDVIECGENNDYWIQVVRSTKKVQFVSKQTGVVAMTVSTEASYDVLLLSMTKGQVGAVRSAMKL